MAKLAMDMKEVLPEFRQYLREETRVLRNMSNEPKRPLDALYDRSE